MDRRRPEAPGRRIVRCGQTVKLYSPPSRAESYDVGKPEVVLGFAERAGLIDWGIRRSRSRSTSWSRRSHKSCQTSTWRRGSPRPRTVRRAARAAVDRSWQFRVRNLNMTDRVRTTSSADPRSCRLVILRSPAHEWKCVVASGTAWLAYFTVRSGVRLSGKLGKVTTGWLRFNVGWSLAGTQRLTARVRSPSSMPAVLSVQARVSSPCPSHSEWVGRLVG